MQTPIREVFGLSSNSDHNVDRCHPGQERIPEFEASGQGERILVVDDHELWLKTARSILSAGGYHVQICQDPQDALLLLKEHPGEIDLVITDMNMPGLNGIELAAKVARIDAGLPVVLTSLGMLELTPERLQTLGIRNFLLKPWDLKELFPIIRQALASKQFSETQ